MAVPTNVEHRETAMRGKVWILLAILPAQVIRDPESLLGKKIRISRLSLQGIKPVQKPDRVTSGRAQTGSSRRIGIECGAYRMINSDHPKSFSSELMAHILQSFCYFASGIVELNAAIHSQTLQKNMDIEINRYSENKSAESFIISANIRRTAA